MAFDATTSDADELAWHVLQDAQSALVTTLIKAEGKRRGLETDYCRIGWTTQVAVYCTDREWDEILTMVRERMR